MTCRAWEDLLQRQMDGDPPQALRQHLLDCPHCAVQAADLARLLGGVARLAPPPVPARLTDSVTRALTAEARERMRASRRTRLAAVAGLAAAAVVLFAVGAHWWQGRDRGRPPDGGGVVARTPEPPPLRDNVAVAGDAVAALTKNTARETTKESAALLSVVKESAEPLTRPSGPVEPQLDKPMREAADGVKDGIAPVTDSARRAVGLFLRDLPGAKNDKPDG